MAKVTITIEDKPNGTVATRCDPSFEMMMKIFTRSNDATAAHTYALCAINAINALSKKSRDVKLILPRTKSGLQ